MLRAVFDHSARRFARKTTISRVGSSVQTCYQRTKTDNAGDQIPESIESHSGIHYRPPLVGFLSVEIQAREDVVPLQQSDERICRYRLTLPLSPRTAFYCAQ